MSSDIKFSLKMRKFLILSLVSCVFLTGCAAQNNTITNATMQSVNTSNTTNNATTKTFEQETGISVPFTEEVKEDPTLEKGKEVIDVQGVNGEKTITYEITTENGKQIKKEKFGEVITKQPVNQVKRKGTKIKIETSSKCDPNYSGCVPIDSDVDCAKGKGNGPSYQYSKVRVIGTDIYGLDGDNDGWACE